MVYKKVPDRVTGTRVGMVRETEELKEDPCGGENAEGVSRNPIG